MIQVNAGQMAHYITIMHHAKDGTERNELGAWLSFDAVKLECWAKMETRTGSLLSGRSAETKLSKTTHKFVVRYDERITPDCWIVYDGHRYDIDYISDPDFTKHWMEIFAEEVTM